MALTPKTDASGTPAAKEPTTDSAGNKVADASQVAGNTSTQTTAGTVTTTTVNSDDDNKPKSDQVEIATLPADAIDSGAPKTVSAVFTESVVGLGNRDINAMIGDPIPDMAAEEYQEDLADAKSRGLKSFADVQVTEENMFDKLQESMEGGVSYTYRHRRTRDFKFGEFHFQDFLMVINDELKNQRWIDQYSTMPMEDRVQIVEYHPEIAAQVERPVGSTTHRGILGTSKIIDPKIQSPAGGQGDRRFLR